jgi:hypothetical protein
LVCFVSAVPTFEWVRLRCLTTVASLLDFLLPGPRNHSSRSWISCLEMVSPREVQALSRQPNQWERQTLASARRLF